MSLNSSLAYFKNSVSIPRNVCVACKTYPALPVAIMRDYQESVTKVQTDAEQSDPYVPLCFAGNTKSQNCSEGSLVSTRVRVFNFHMCQVAKPCFLKNQWSEDLGQCKIGRTIENHLKCKKVKFWLHYPSSCWSDNCFKKVFFRELWKAAGKPTFVKWKLNQY